MLLITLAAASLAFPAQDTVEVTANGPPAWGDVTLVEEWRAGSVSGEDGTAFALIADVEEACDGSVWVVDRLIPTIRVLDGASGEPMGTVGREGEGPGEFVQTSGLERLGDCRMALYDHALGRITLFDSRDGQVIDTYASPAEGAMRGGKMAQYTEGGRLYTWTRTGPRDDRRAAWIGHEVDARGAALDTLVLPRPRPRGSVFTTRDGAPFTVETSASLTHLGLLWGRNDRYAVHRRREDGSVLRITRPVDRVPLAPGERRQWEAVAERVEAQAGDVPGTRVAELPDEKPFFRSIGADRDGRIWVRRYASAVEAAAPDGEVRWREPPVYDVLSEDGQYLGEIRLVPGQRLVAVWGDRIYVVERGAYDEPYLVKYSFLVEDGAE